MRRILTVMFLICLSSLPVLAQEIFVSPDGDDSQDGNTIDTSVRTIGRAVELASDGSTIYVLDDNGTLFTYAESIPIIISFPLSIRAINPDGDDQQVRVIPETNGTDLITISSSGVTIEGMILDGINGTNQNDVESVQNLLRVTPLTQDLSDITISNNRLVNASANAITISTSRPGVGVSNLAISNNIISNNNVGVSVAAPLKGNSRIFENDLSGNISKALVNNTTQAVNASFNWWGGADPSAVTRVLSVSGNRSINILIDYNPWFNSGDIDPAEGFQPLYNSLSVRKQNNNPVLAEAISSLIVGGQVNIYSRLANTTPYEALTIDKFVTLAGAGLTPPLINGLTLNQNANLSGTIRVEKQISLNDNVLQVSTVASSLQLPFSVAQSLEGQSGRIIGPVETSTTVNPNQSIEALGVSITAGNDGLGTVTIERIAGASAVENENIQSIRTIWDITASNSFDTALLTLTWPSIYDNGVFADQAVVWKNPGPDDNGWQAVNPANPVDATQEGTNVRSVEVKVTSFSQFTVSDINKPLPVELTSFNASLLKTHVQLNWETASEENADFFAIERSENGLNFSQVGKLKAAGNSDAPLQYRYIDEQAAKRFSGTLFYRLRTVDFDGSYEYSDIISVSVSGEDIPMIAAFAREGQETMKIFTRSIEPGEYQLWITDLSGRKIFDQEVELRNNQEHLLNIGNLPNAIYTVRCTGKEIFLATKFKVE